MNLRIVDKEVFQVVGMKVETRMSENKIPELWQHNEESEIDLYIAIK